MTIRSLLAALALAGAWTAAAATELRSDFARVMRGARVFQQHCAACHGRTAQGSPDWRRRGPDGRFPPPPLDGSGHAWHHPTAVLREVIREGTVKDGGGMPAWKGRLDEGQIDDVIAWIQSRWPEPVYRRWQEIERRSGRR
ncbi:c-type cytochrome [Inmirania thermothiophila]|uniref:c-type cytochrome n=1 Tax=Inmirania thermothiophila TaxID=1750597 RepID=UPI001B877549|nr:cytochrome c [Inmirania thermothiophila]